MDSEMKRGTGEYGVAIHSTARYHQELSEPELQGYGEAICTYFMAPVPVIEVASRKQRRWGTYYHKQQRVVINRPVLGVLIHEMAHHINHVVHGGRMHDETFKVVLNELFRWWEI